MKKNLIILLLMTGFCCLSLNAQKPLKKPAKQQNTQSSTTTTPSLHPAKSKPTATTVVATGTINGHEYVDLGLTVKWATCNVGASKPSDYGDYFAWGETRTKSEYTIKNVVIKDENINDISGNLQYDAAHVCWGTTWRMPTKTEFEELIEKCKWTWTTYNGHDGYKVIGSNGNSIFLPAAGYRKDNSLLNSGECCLYWSSTPKEVLHFISTPKEKSCLIAAFLLISCDDRQIMLYESHFIGCCIRPVSE